MTILPRSVQVTNVFEYLYNATKTVVVNRGGARSSKSYSIAQYLVFLMTHDDYKILVTRKTLPSLRITAMKLVVDLLKEYDLYRFCHHNKTENSILFQPTNSYTLFSSIDDPEKVKSTEWNYIWMEEATDFKYEDYMILKMRLSAPTNTTNQILLSFNPIGAYHWIKTNVIDVEDVDEYVSTYKDNPFLSQDYIDLLMSVKEQNPIYWQIYGEGAWGQLENIIYSNWKEVKDFPTPERTIYGCDFGYNSPTAIVKIGLKDDKVYLDEILYKSKLTNSDLIGWMEKEIPTGSIVYCDSAEPARITEIRRSGIEAQSSDKSVVDGLDFCRRQELYITSSSNNLLKEISSYSYKQDKQGNVLEEPVKMNDHLLDAMRYALYTHMGNRPNYNIITGD